MNILAGSDSWPCLQNQHHRMCRGHEQSRHRIKTSPRENHTDGRRKIKHISRGDGKGEEALGAE